MLYRQLARTDLKVSVICQGTWSLATQDVFWDGQDRTDSVAAIHASLDAGVNFFDTAPVYGNGESEEILGEALGSRRDQVILATKVPPSDLEPTKLRERCEKSLRALRTEAIDLYQIHWPNKFLPLEATFATLEALRQEGKIRHIGVSNFGVSFLQESLPLARIASNQLPYNLLWRAVEYEVQPLCAARDIGILCYSPLGQGLLAGKYLAAEAVPEKRARTRLFSSARKQTRHGEAGCEPLAFDTIAKIHRLAETCGLAMDHLALAWLLRQASVTSVIVGSRNAAQAVANAAAAHIQINDELNSLLLSITDPLKQTLGNNLDPWEHVSRMER